MPIESVNPATGEVLERYTPFAPAELEARLDRARTAFLEYRRSSFGERAVHLLRAAELLDSEKDDLGRLITTEMGKPIGAAVAEVEKCARVCRFYAEHGARFLSDEEVPTDARRSFVRYAPLGPVLAIMPWNFPFWQVFRFAAPALMAGNVGLLKHASNVPGCALAMEDLLRRAGFPEGAFQALLVEVEAVSRVIGDPRVRGVTLTGSTRAGSAVAERAGAHIKKSVLELGGSDPYIVMPSADLPLAIRTAVTARVINNGQSCIAAKRFIVHEAVYDEFAAGFVAGLESLRLGDPLDPATELGPLATAAILAEVEEQVQRSVAVGARILTGGTRLERPGNYYAPTALDELLAEAPALREEIFGPVAALLRVASVAEAVRIANDTPFGLAASVWTTDPEEGERFVEGIEAGLIFLNAMVASDPRLPFGGVKTSGFGRELGALGIREFVNAQTIWIGGENHASTE